MFRMLKRYIVRHERLNRIAVKVREFLFDVREKDKSFGSLNPDKKFYVIRGNTNNIGLLAIYFRTLNKIYYSIVNGFTPVVDFENYKTAYNVNFPVNGTRNMWEYYFEQPSEYSLSEVYKSMNVRLSSGIRQTPPSPKGITTYGKMAFAPVKKYIMDIAREKAEADGIREMIGVLVRGTDYSALKPVHHDIPATAEQTAEKLDEFLARHGESRILLATEDGKIHDYFVKKYGELIYTTDGGRNLIRNYSGKDFVSQETKTDNKYQLGLDYLVRMICLSECKCLISSVTHGLELARTLNHGRYQEEYIFRLGRY